MKVDGKTKVNAEAKENKEKKEEPKFSRTHLGLAIAGVLISAVSAIGGGAFAVFQNNATTKDGLHTQRLNICKDKLEAYQESDKKNLPELLKNMSAVSDSLKERMNILNDYDSLKKNNESLSYANMKLSERLEVDSANYLHEISLLEEKLKSERAEYQNQFNSFQNEIDTFRASVTPFELKQGHGITLKSGQVRVGFSDSNMMNVCKVTVNNKKYELEAGASVDVTVKERPCKVIINRCAYSSSTPANFELVCS